MSNVLSAPDIAARIMAQADANGPCGPKRGAIHESEYDALYRHCLYCGMPGGGFPEAGSGLAVWGPNGPVTLFPAEDVPVGAIRWEPRE